MLGFCRNASLSKGLNRPDFTKLFSTTNEISAPISFFFNNFSKFSLDSLSIDRGETAIGRGLKLPLVMSTSIKEKALIGNKIININKYLNNILTC